MSKGYTRIRRSFFSLLFSTAVLLDILALLVALIYLGLQQLTEQVRANILEGIAANLITASTVTIVGVAAFILLSVIQRRQLFRFFGIRRGVLGMHLYLSRLQVLPGGTVGTEPISRGYSGPAIVKSDYDAALLLIDLFQPHAIALIPDILRELLSAVSITLSDVYMDVEIAPLLEHFSEDQYISQNLITCGGAIYNSISCHYLNSERSFYYFAKNADGDRVLRARDNSAPNLDAEGRASGHELACIQRLNDPEHDTTVFVCAGLGSGATYGSVDYLVRNWRRLLRQYGDKEFGICLSFDTRDYDEIPTVKPREIHRISRQRSH